MVKKNGNVKVPKEENINVRCTKQQKVALEALAAEDGVGVSTWLLQQGLRVLRELQERKAERDARR